MSRDIVPLGLRMPPEVKEQIEAAARANGRSMNAEIVARLQASFSASPIGPAADTALLVDVVSAMAIVLRSLSNQPGPPSDPRGLLQLTEAFTKLNDRIKDLHSPRKKDD